MIFGQYHLFLGIGAAHRGTIAVVARGNPPGTDALNPGYFVGMLPVGRAQDLTFVRTGGAQQPFEVHTGYNVLHLPIAVAAHHRGIERLEPGGQNDGPDVDVCLLRRLLKIDGVIFTDAFADPALFFFEVKTAFIDISDKGNGLRIVDMDGFVLRKLLVEWIGVVDRAVFDTGRAPGAFVLDNVPGLFNQADLEVSCFPFDTVNFG
jgi:hypothetical protein